MSTDPLRGDTTLHHRFGTSVSPLQRLGIVMRRCPRAYARGYRSVAPVGLRMTRRYFHTPGRNSVQECTTVNWFETHVMADPRARSTTQGSERLYRMARSKLRYRSCTKRRQYCHGPAAHVRDSGTCIDSRLFLRWARTILERGSGERCRTMPAVGCKPES